MNQANNLASGPDLEELSDYAETTYNRTRQETTYTIVRVTVQEDLTTTLAAHIGSNLSKVTSCALLLNLKSVLGHLVSEQAGSVLPPTQHKSGISLLRLDDSLLNILVNRSLDGAHEASTHVNTLGTESQRSSQTVAISETTRSNERNAEVLTGTAQENEVGDIVLADVTGTLEAIDGEEINTQLHGGLGVADGGALVEDGDARLLELLDDGAGVVAGSLDDLDALIDDDLGVGTVVGGNHGGEEGQVDTEGVLGHFAASSDFLAQVFGGGLGEGSELEARR